MDPLGWGHSAPALRSQISPTPQLEAQKATETYRRIRPTPRVSAPQNFAHEREIMIDAGIPFLSLLEGDNAPTFWLLPLRFLVPNPWYVEP